MNDNIISREKYDYYRNYLGYEKFLEKVKGKKLVEEDNTIEDCGVNFISNIISIFLSYILFICF